MAFSRKVGATRRTLTTSRYVNQYQELPRIVMLGCQLTLPLPIVFWGDGGYLVALWRSMTLCRPPQVVKKQLVVRF